jgi:hypothetical protein
MNNITRLAFNTLFFKNINNINSINNIKLKISNIYINKKNYSINKYNYHNRFKNNENETYKEDTYLFYSSITLISTLFISNIFRRKKTYIYKTFYNLFDEYNNVIKGQSYY